MNKKSPTMPQETWSEFAEGPLLRSEVELLKARVAGGETAMVAVAVTVKRLTAERDTALAENARLLDELNQAREEYEGLTIDFEGVTDNADDPDRLHTWSWLESVGRTKALEAKHD